MGKIGKQISIIEEIEEQKEKEKNCGMEMFYNGFKIEGKYIVQKNDIMFIEELVDYDKEREHIDEFILILHRESKVKEVRFKGIIKQILVGDWE